MMEKNGLDPLKCPTCRSVPDKDGYREYGQYCLDGKIHDCDCEEQLALRRHYTLAGIGRQYQELDWSTYDGPQEILDTIGDYIDNFENYRDYGMGLEFHSPMIGTGKSFAATHILKEVIKQGYTGMIIDFQRLVDIMGNPKKGEEIEDLAKKMESVTLLVIDDILPPKSGAQKSFFQDKLEIIVRYRTDWNLPCIITTNMMPNDLKNHYPRIYSLLSAKQLDKVYMPGDDNRATKVFLQNVSRPRKGERSPIT